MDKLQFMFFAIIFAGIGSIFNHYYNRWVEAKRREIEEEEIRKRNSKCSPSHPKYTYFNIVKHTNGVTYKIIAIPSVCFIENNRVPAYAYHPVGYEGRIYVRPQYEMEDGRFIFVSSSEDQNGNQQ
jgi:hypothetical protein